MSLIAIHMLQNHAPSNLNRDENGDPKDAVFGGVRRARISSQAQKRAIRHSETFQQYFSGLDVSAVRSKLPTLIRENTESTAQIAQLSPDETKQFWSEVAKIGKSSRSETNIATDKEAKVSKSSRSEGEATADKETDEPAGAGQLMFLTNSEVVRLTSDLIQIVQQPIALVDAVDQNGKSKKKSKKESGNRSIAEQSYMPHSVDIAMFGRMTTSSPFKDIEAAVQVAHALSTHRIEQEFDFFTAVDDRGTGTGAGLLGETAFNSATYYKYINIHWEGLVQNLNGDMDLARKTVHALIHAALVAIPSGKQNSFAAHNLPDWVLVEIRPQNIPLSYANAFLKPVRPQRDASLMEASIEAINDYIGRTDRLYPFKDVERTVISTQAESSQGLPDLLDWVTQHNALNS